MEGTLFRRVTQKVLVQRKAPMIAQVNQDPIWEKSDFMQNVSPSLIVSKDVSHPVRCMLPYNWILFST